MTAGHETDTAHPTPVVRATDETLPYGVVTNEVTDGWAVVHVPTLEVVGDRLYPSEAEALEAAAEHKHRDEREERANRFFDEELVILEEKLGD